MALWIRYVLPVFALLCGVFITPRLAVAQCTPTWQAFDPATASYPGVRGSVYATTMWDPDGFGPQSAKLVVGGSFVVAGSVYASNIALLDPATGAWAPLGLGFDSDVWALATLPSGDLIAAGQFTNSGGVVVNHIARWTGASWSALGTGMNSTVWALATLPSGELVAGGQFSTAGGVAANHIAQWDGSAWSALGSGTDNTVRALTTLWNGDIVAGGDFATAGSVVANRIARWSFGSWSPLGTGVSDGVAALITLPNGDVVAGGAFTAAGGVAANYIAQWNGVSWSALGTGMDAGVVTLLALPSGGLIAGGGFSTAGSVAADRIARWNGASWSALGSGLNDQVFALTTLPNGDLIVGGAFSTAGGVAARSVARWSGTAVGEWTALGTGIDSTVYALATLPNGDLVAGGDFTTAGGVPANRIAEWNGSSWSALGSGVTGGLAFTRVNALAVLSDGDIVAGGDFTSAGGVSANFVARWNGTSWSALGAGTDGIVHAVVELPNGDIVVGGEFTAAGGASASFIARWNGFSWSALGTGMSNASWSPLNALSVRSLLVLSNGDLVAGGRFRRAGGVFANNIARWNGLSWAPLGAGVGGDVNGLVRLPSGLIVAGGSFNRVGGVTAVNGSVSNSITAPGVALWNGSSWSAFGTGLQGNPVYAVTTLPSGELVAGGSFASAGSATVSSIARWNGATWSAVGNGLGPNDGIASVRALASLPSGDLVAGGNFTGDGVIAAHAIARWTDTVVPQIAAQPESQTVTAGSTVTLAATPSPGRSCVSVQWRRNGVNIVDGPGGASPGGGTVSGAWGSSANTSPATLTIVNAQPSDGGQYTVVFASTFGSVTSEAATVSVIDTSESTGACCSGVTCSILFQASCIGLNRRFAGIGSVCNAPENNTTPCCRSDFTQDGTRASSDIFAFLNAYFSSDPSAVVLSDFDGSGTRQPADLFAFLNAYFAGGC